MKKNALITGITGQDGSYLTEFLLNKNYIVHGLIRPSSYFNRWRIEHIYMNPVYHDKKFFLHYGDMNDSSSLKKIIDETKPLEIYNLAAQSHVKRSFDIPEYTAGTNAIGSLRLLDIIKNLKYKTKFYQASSSEMYGDTDRKLLDENSYFAPSSPYASAKLFSHWVVNNYCESYNLFGCNGILFNHESPRRGESFVTRKITLSAARIKYGLQKKLYLGNINAFRDWGHARDYVEMQWLMLQQDEPDDYVIASGEQHSVREFIELVGFELGIEIIWKGKGLNEVGIIGNMNPNLEEEYNHLYKDKVIIKIAPDYFRPSEVDSLLGDATKAKEKLGWEPKISFTELIKEMVQADLQHVKNELHINFESS